MYYSKEYLSRFFPFSSQCDGNFVFIAKFVDVYDVHNLNIIEHLLDIEMPLNL